jgi:aryl-alcohol dehydrogenase-like predicted oxidoreductase
LDKPEGIKPDRRRLLRIGAGIGAGFAFPWASSLLSAAELPLITKSIPSSGERIPAIGLGTIWYRDSQYQALRNVIQRLGEVGGMLVDTAAAYGESEGLVGRALAEIGSRGRMFISTKFDSGRPPPPNSGAASAPNALPIPGPPDGVSRPQPDGVGGMASVERSFQRLQTDRIDLLQVHGMNGTDELMPLLMDLKKSGRVRYIGVTTSSPLQHKDLAAVIRRYPLDFVQVDYSIGNRSAEAEVLPAAIERKVAVMTNLPLGRATLLRALASTPLPAWAADIDVHSWSQFLLKYVISHPAVTCAIPGTTNVDHLVENMGACRGRLPDAATRMRMEALWAEVSQGK